MGSRFLSCPCTCPAWSGAAQKVKTWLLRPCSGAVKLRVVVLLSNLPGPSPEPLATREAAGQVVEVPTGVELVGEAPRGEGKRGAEWGVGERGTGQVTVA